MFSLYVEGISNHATCIDILRHIDLKYCVPISYQILRSKHIRKVCQEELMKLLLLPSPAGDLGNLGSILVRTVS